MINLFSNLNETLPQSEITRASLFLSDLYDEVDGNVTRFSKTNDLSCPVGCGKCCEKHEPVISIPEAEYVAAWLHFSNTDIEKRLSRIKERDYCIFYDENTPYHCSIYSVRPLICRSFGFTGFVKKDSTPGFRPCKEIKSDVKWKEHKWVNITPASFAGDKLEAAFPGAHAQLSPVSDAIYHAWFKLQMLLKYSQDDPDKRPPSILQPKKCS